MTVELHDADVAVKCLLRDRDAEFGLGFDAVWEGGVRPWSPVRAPNANAVAERWVRTVRSECTDRLLILNERHLRRVLDRYVHHYEEHRPPRGLALRPPLRPAASARSSPGAIASVCRQDVLGGVINDYHAA